MKYSRGPTAVGGWGHCCHHLVPLATCVHGCPCSNAQGAEHHRRICCPLEAALLPGVPISIWTGMLGLAGNCPGPRAVPGATTGRKVALAGAQHQQRGCCYITRHRARHGDSPLCLPQRLLLHQTWARLACRQHGPVPQHPHPTPGCRTGTGFIISPLNPGTPGRAVSISLRLLCTEPWHWVARGKLADGPSLLRGLELHWVVNFSISFMGLEWQRVCL